MKRILIANRGEIALRIMRTAHSMGIECVAVYSDADVHARHVREADAAYRLGPPPSSQSYLLMDTLVEIALKSGCDAVHPGYGFLSERPEFARKVKQAGLIFIGPSAESMEMMGSKIAAKQAAIKHNVPLVPGTDFAISDVNQAKKMALEIGFPLLIKASAGGGGKGMRIVHQAEELEEQLKTATNEALAAFGDGSVFLERYVSKPRHIEFQIIADNFGNVVHLFERECSIQRRHQKLVEEAPSAILTPEKRDEMGQCAVKIAKACMYSGAGTIEFLLDEELNFYFLEMNTRLQVEHPVTEFITGLDLVKEQIRIANNEPLGYTQNEVSINGHAIEIRVCAEDPLNDFMPDTGTLTTYKIPYGQGIRVDDGMEQGSEVSVYYDPMIAKLIVKGENRNEAIAKLTKAIDSYFIEGVKTTLPFCRFAVNHPAFINGDFDTHFVKNHFKPEALAEDLANETEAALALAGFLLKKNQWKNSLQQSTSDKWISRKWHS